jgi:flagellar basal-body rod modification protein FlgD
MSTIAATSSAASSVSSTDTSSTSSVTKQTLTQDDFLSLLVKQMTTQDPMNPQSDENFIAQLAQFSTLEQTKSMGSDLTKLYASQQAAQANSYLGKTVVVQVDDSTTAQGVVTSVDLSGDTPKVVINGVSYDSSSVISVTTTTTTN